MCGEIKRKRKSGGGERLKRKSNILRSSVQSKDVAIVVAKEQQLAIGAGNGRAVDSAAGIEGPFCVAVGSINPVYDEPFGTDV